MQQVEIEAIRAQALQAALACAQRALVACIGRQHFAHQEDFVAPAGNRLAGEFLGAPAAVHLGGIDVRESQIDAGAQRLASLRRSASAEPSIIQVPCPITGTCTPVQPNGRRVIMSLDIIAGWSESWFARSLEPCCGRRFTRRLRNMSVPRRARPVTPKSTTAGARRAWRTSCAIRSEHPDAIIPDLDQAGSAAHLQEGRHRLRLRQQVEAALLQEGRRRLFPAARAMGRHPQDLARLFRPRRHRLVGAALSRRQHEAPHRTALRRLPFRELQHADQRGHRVERRLREVSRPGQRARRQARRAPTSSTRRGSIPSAPTTPASSAIRRGSR